MDINEYIEKVIELIDKDMIFKYNPHPKAEKRYVYNSPSTDILNHPRLPYNLVKTKTCYYMNDYENIYTTNNFNNAFAKILMKGHPGDILFNTFIKHSPLIFDIPLKTLSELKISYLYPDELGIFVSNGYLTHNEYIKYRNDFEKFNNQFSSRTLGR